MSETLFLKTHVCKGFLVRTCNIRTFFKAPKTEQQLHWEFFSRFIFRVCFFRNSFDVDFFSTELVSTEKLKKNWRKLSCLKKTDLIGLWRTKLGDGQRQHCCSAHNRCWLTWTVLPLCSVQVLHLMITSSFLIWANPLFFFVYFCFSYLKF